MRPSSSASCPRGQAADNHLGVLYAWPTGSGWLAIGRDASTIGWHRWTGHGRHWAEHADAVGGRRLSTRPAAGAGDFPDHHVWRARGPGDQRRLLVDPVLRTRARGRGIGRRSGARAVGVQLRRGHGAQAGLAVARAAGGAGGHHLPPAACSRRRSGLRGRSPRGFGPAADTRPGEMGTVRGRRREHARDAPGARHGRLRGDLPAGGLRDHRPGHFRPGQTVRHRQIRARGPGRARATRRNQRADALRPGPARRARLQPVGDHPEGRAHQAAGRQQPGPGQRRAQRTDRHRAAGAGRRPPCGQRLPEHVAGPRIRHGRVSAVGGGHRRASGRQLRSAQRGSRHRAGDGAA
jgi:hypothetical protein